MNKNAATLQTIDASSHPFFSFRMTLSQNALVMDAVRGLQSQRTLNANLIFFLIWFAQVPYGRLQKRDLTALRNTLYPWHEHVTLSLGRLEHLLERSGPTASAELQQWVTNEWAIANQIEQKLLIEVSVKMKKSRKSRLQQLFDACYNVIAYAKLQQVSLTSEDLKAITVILKPVFHDLPDVELTQQLSEAVSAAKLTQPVNCQLVLETF